MRGGACASGVSEAILLWLCEVIYTVSALNPDDLAAMARIEPAPAVDPARAVGGVASAHVLPHVQDKFQALLSIVMVMSVEGDQEFSWAGGTFAPQGFSEHVLRFSA